MDDFLRRFCSVIMQIFSEMLLVFVPSCDLQQRHTLQSASVHRCIAAGNLIFIASFQPIHTAASVRAAVFQGTFLTAIRRCLPMNQLPNFFLVQPVKNIAQQIIWVVDELCECCPEFSRQMFRSRTVFPVEIAVRRSLPFSVTLLVVVPDGHLSSVPVFHMRVAFMLRKPSRYRYLTESV